MVVVIVGQHDRIDGRQSVELDSGGNPASRAYELERRGPLAPDRIDQDVEPGHLNEKARMSDPRKREDLRICARNYEMRSHPNEHAGIGVGSAWISTPFDHRPLEEIQHTMRLRRRPWIPESSFRPMMRGKAL
jgi:hypothetical protein